MLKTNFGTITCGDGREKNINVDIRKRDMALYLFTGFAVVLTCISAHFDGARAHRKAVMDAVNDKSANK